MPPLVGCSFILSFRASQLGEQLEQAPICLRVCLPLAVELLGQDAWPEVRIARQGLHLGVPRHQRDF